MPRIPEAELDRIKREVDLVALVQSKGIELKKHGSKDLAGLSPFSEEKTPSFILTPGKNLWHCMSSGKGGSVIDFVMHYEGVSFRHAFEILAQGNVATLMRANRPVKVSTTPKLASPVAFDADDQTLLRQVVEYYHQRLKQTPLALDYLRKRGLSPEAADHFQIGYADRTLGLTLPETQTQAGRDIRERLKKIGLLRAETGHEHFNGCIVFPITDEAGNITEIYGRKVYSHLRPGTLYHLYLPGPHMGIFNGAALKSSRDIILCEAVIDAATFWCAGYHNVTCIYGTEGFTDELAQAFLTHKTRRIFLAYDRDKAGDRAAERDAAKFLSQGIECYRVKFPHAMDANEYARKVTPAEKSLRLMIQSAEWLGQGRAPAPPEPAVEPPPAREKEPWEKVPVEIAAPLAKELGQELKGVAHDVDEDTGDHLPCVSNVSLQTGQGWCEEPYWPAPFKEVEAQQEQLQKMAEERGLLPSGPTPLESQASPSSSLILAAELAAQPEEATNKKMVEVPAEPTSPVVPGPGLETSPSGDLSVQLGDRHYRIRGLDKNGTCEVLKINLRLMVNDLYHVNVIDFYQAKQRAAFIEDAAKETLLDPELIKRDLGKILLQLEQVQEEKLRDTLAPKTEVVVMNEADRKAALELLRDPRLLDRLLADFERCGVVGESTNKLTGYLASVSRKLDRPLAIIIQSTSAAGKSSLMEAVLAFVPPEEKIKYSAMTGQSLYYLGETDLKNKILAIVEEEGAEKASYALKLLQSEGELTIASTTKDEQGRLRTEEYHVEGPVMIFLTTTAVDVDDELLNRCIVLTVDESREQTEAIHHLQREGETLAGLERKLEREAILSLHQHAQRLLRAMPVVNPFAPQLTFLSDRTRTRRDHVKYLTLIRTVTLLHQYQRPTKTLPNGTSYIEVTAEDITIANRLAHEVLGRSLDELPPQTRKLAELLYTLITQRCAEQKMETRHCLFSRRDVRAWTGWGDTQLKVHLARLQDMEYLALHRHPGHSQGFLYELIYDGSGREGNRFLPGLIDMKAITEQNRSGQNGHQSGAGRPLVGGVSGESRPPVIGGNGSHPKRLRIMPAAQPENTQPPLEKVEAIVA